MTNTLLASRNIVSDLTIKDSYHHFENPDTCIDAIEEIRTLRRLLVDTASPEYIEFLRLTSMNDYNTLKVAYEEQQLELD